MEAPAILVRDLVKRFPNQAHNVLENVSFSVAAGECVALLGPSGCGKTTLLRLLMGIEAPTSGTLVVEESLRSRLAYVFQEPRLVPWRTTLENVLLPFELTGSLTAETRELAVARLRELGLGERLAHFPRELSGGMQMRVALARALVTRPRVLLLDEPFAGIDPIAVIEIQRIISFLKQRGIGVLITDHNVRETLGICDHAYIISDGSVLAQGTPSEIVNDAEVRRVYLGEHFKM